MKKVFVANGTEDGILGVFTTKKLAYECAVKYTEANGGTKVTYRVACSLLNDQHYADVESNLGYGSASITQFYLNQM